MFYTGHLFILFIVDICPYRPELTFCPFRPEWTFVHFVQNEHLSILSRMGICPFWSFVQKYRVFILTVLFQQVWHSCSSPVHYSILQRKWNQIETDGKTRQIDLFDSKHRKRKCYAIPGRPFLHQSVQSWSILKTMENYSN